MPGRMGLVALHSNFYQDVLVKAGAVTVAAFIPQGVRVPVYTLLRSVTAHVGTAPVGAAMIIQVKRASTVLATVTIADGATSGSVAATATATILAAGDLLTFNVTQVGSGTAGSDLSISLDCYGDH